MSASVLRRVLAGPIAAFAVLVAVTAAAQNENDAPSSDAPPDAPADEASAPASNNNGDGDGAARKHDDEETSSTDEKPEAAEESASAEVEVSLAPPSKEPFRRFWVGVAGSLDLALTSPVKDVCLLNALAKPATTAGAYCTSSSGSDFPSRTNLAENAALVPGRAGNFGGGVVIGDVHFMLAADYAVTASILAGVRLGYEFNTYPGDAGISARPTFLRNLHLEARGTYVFGEDALSRVGFAPTAFAGFGVATTDAHVRTTVSQAGARGKTPVEAWRLAGPGLFAVGGGARYAFSGRAAFNAALKLELAFGYASPLFAFGPELAFQYGF